ncbi:VLRF1 family aeRF1-type release factor [Oceanobacillus sp. AG]|uniref:VLRF1 family aeRF1-type release factor n=1 Tax=Oceanobacillus sp. AG TaxID=2681969 RepID=UPI001E2CAD5E|nr:VLRF1 family aeRF1-type release factor [Oceanobacillus sp. AG]
MSLTITETINWLKDVRKEGANKVFTMYLNTDRSDPNQQGGEWKIHLKNGMRNFETYLQQDDNTEELNNFKKVKKKAMDFIKENEQQLQRGIIIYATADDDVWFAKCVQMRLEDEFYWQETPEINQLIELSEKYPKLGIVLVQQNQVKVIDSEANRVKEITYFELDVDTEDWKIKQGPRRPSTAGAGGPNVHKDSFESRFAANQHRWYKKIAPKLDKIAKNNQWEQLYMVGEGDSTKELGKLMHRPIDAVLQKNMLDHEETKVLEEVLA